MARTGREPDGASLPSRTAPVRFATFTLDLDGCSLSRADGGDVALTHNEFALLRVLVRHPGRALSRDYLLDALVGKRAGPFDRGVDVLVGRLRRKIEPDPKEPRLIVTVPGEGYRFDGLAKPQSSDQKLSLDVLAPQNDGGREGHDAGSGASPQTTAADRAKSPASRPRFGSAPLAAAIVA